LIRIKLGFIALTLNRDTDDTAFVGRNFRETA